MAVWRSPRPGCRVEGNECYSSDELQHGLHYAPASHIRYVIYFVDSNRYVLLVANLAFESHAMVLNAILYVIATILNITSH